MSRRFARQFSRRGQRELEALGYSFTGIYVRDKEEAKLLAAKKRGEGFFAQVVTTLSSGRVYDKTGYSVYAKPKKDRA